MTYSDTLLTIKQQALQGYRSRQFVTGTVASFNTTSIVDLTRQEPQGEFERVDSFIKFTSGPAIGSESRVMGWSPASSYILFAPSVPSLNASTNYQITKTFRDSDVGIAVNSALRDVAPERRIQSFATTNESGGVQILSVPSAAGNAIADIVRVDRSFGTTNSPYQFREIYNGSDFMVDIDSGSYVLRLNYPAVSGNIVRFHYRRPAAELTNDTDSTDEPMSLILTGTKKWLAAQEGDDALLQKYGREFEAEKRDFLRNQPVRTINTPRMGVIGYGGGNGRGNGGGWW